ncbi:conserved Plasmodium protein, unknown function [Plasmodium knowlesi strain H]|uniref:Uncharacterized protein n=3 Tax=Plasmodium knowlesi TaxID=5850 RepID=A0A5K1UGK6_PLAKH|nr:conserved Plasmodium protein, unknown function [Plasmodium knowlesi strain H]OTN67386.1 Uncharacterized protein PKNOH_S06423100 [Plasmodium knowlesi]CAA9987504.1 conserved Plasmodium protein, unknown function [Plasmodium knowlesi strain H]SBO23162.1 conserved Plasmodium protein, unknown function [Plasmodium knowlesi strain H]SBO23836.1 conserved Plasmodium protein, unknown function [Plasmodium knowlesi strain H]VVS76978.1 conserved Plasmodium protein, unknown function [Plasmodium knowlesi s|eukprot:XP_002258505.1 hypothetical protein, conserved in Plasmodium species [Plasmodium knowlesi strain H]
MDLNDKRNGEKQQLSSGAMEEDGNEMVRKKCNTNKRIYIKYHEGEYYKEEENEDGGIPHKRNKRPSRTPPSIDDHEVDKGKVYHLAKNGKKAKVLNELSFRALSTSGRANNLTRDGDDQDNYDGGDHRGKGIKCRNNGGGHDHSHERKMHNMRKMALYPSHTDTSPGGKANLGSNSIPSSVSLKKGSGAQEDESTADEHTPRNRGRKIYKLKSNLGSSPFMFHPDGRRRRVSLTGRRSFSQSSVETSEGNFQGGKYVKEGRGDCQQGASHGSDESDKRCKRGERDERDKHAKRRGSYEASSPYEDKYLTQEAKRGEHRHHHYVVEGRGRPHGAHRSGESVRREYETSSGYRRESALNKFERNEIHKGEKHSSRRSGSPSSGRSRSEGAHGRNELGRPYYSRRKRQYSPPSEEDRPNTYREKWQSVKEKQDWHKDGRNYYHGEGDYQKELPPKENYRESLSRGGSAKLSEDREDTNLKRRKKEYHKNREWRERPLHPHRDEENESSTGGEEPKAYYDNHSREREQRSGKYDLQSNECSSRKRDRSEMDNEVPIYDQRRHYYPHEEEYHPRGRNHIKLLNKWKGDIDDEEKKEEFKPSFDDRLHDQFEGEYHGDRHNEKNPCRNRRCDKSGEIGSDIFVNELNSERIKKKKKFEFVQIDGNVEIELLYDADFTNWVSDDRGVSEEAGIGRNGDDVVGGEPIHIKFRNSHLRKFVLCSNPVGVGKVTPPGEWSHSFTHKRSVSIRSSDGSTYSHNNYAPSSRVANYKQGEYKQNKNPPTSFVGNKYYDVSLLKKRGSHSDRSESPDSFRRNGHVSSKNSVSKYDCKIERPKHISSVDGEENKSRSSSASAVRDTFVECENGREGKLQGGSRWGGDRRKCPRDHQVEDNERMYGGRRGRSRSRNSGRSRSRNSGRSRSSNRGRSRSSSRGSNRRRRRLSISRDTTHNTHGDSRIQEMITPRKYSGHRGLNGMEREKDKEHSQGENYGRRSPEHAVHAEGSKSPHAQSGMNVEGESNHRRKGKNYGNDTRITEKDVNRTGAQEKVATIPTWVNVPEFGSIPNYINEIIKNMNSSYEINEPIDMLNLKAGKSFRTPELLHFVKQMTSTKSFLNFLEKRKEAQRKWKMVARNIVHEEFKILSDSISSDVIDAKIKYLTNSLRSL